MIPDVEYPITLEYREKPALRLKGKVQSIKKEKARISISDDEWDTFYFESVHLPHNPKDFTPEK